MANVNSFSAQGCFVDTGKPRLLGSGSLDDAGGLTVATCVAKAGLTVKYAAVESGSHCYWGNYLVSSKVADSKCGTACGGNDTELCGGTGAANVYLNNKYVPNANVSREAILELMERYHDLVDQLIADIKLWQEAIASTKGTTLRARSLTVTESYQMVATSYRTIETFTGHVGSTFSFSRSSDSWC